MARLLYIYAFMLPWMSLMWANSLFFSIELLAFVTKIVNVTFFAAAFLTILTASNGLRFKSKAFLTMVVVLFSLNVFYSFIGLLNGYTDKNIDDFYTLINGVFISFAVFQSTSLFQNSENILDKVSRIFLFSLVGAVFVMLLEGILGIPHYPALAPGWAVFPLFVMLLNGQSYKAAALYLLLLLSGKRSILFLALAVGSIIVFWKRKISISAATVLSGALFIPCALILLFAIETLPENEISAINKLKLINPFSEEFDPVVAAGERVEEVVAAIEAQGNTPFNIITGMGNGFTYELKIDRKNFFEEDRHNVHFTPVNYYTRYGIVFAITYYGILIACTIYIFNGIRRKSIHAKAMAFYIVYGLLSSLISYSLPLDYLFWFCFGVLMRMKWNEKQASIQKAVT